MAMSPNPPRDDDDPASASAALNRSLTPTPFLGSLISQPQLQPIAQPPAIQSATPSAVPLSPSSAMLYRLCGLDHEDDLIAQLHGWTRSFAGLQPRFSFSHLLGEGSQGFIFTVYDRDCRREIALKTLNSSTCEPDDIARFINEAQITAQLEHPGIVPVHDFGVMPNGAVFYTMKKVQGESLGEYFSTRAGSPEHRFHLIEIFIKVCETMSYAHSRGVIHRDLKPRNIMVGKYGEVVIIDWGLAKILRTPFHDNPVSLTQVTSEECLDDHATREGQAVGTPAYMSPEQANGQGMDVRCDIYSLGVLLYEILAGTSPYQRGDIRRTLDQVRQDVWTRLDNHHRGRELPRTLIAIVHKAMAHYPTQRYQTAEALVNDLRAFLAGQAISAYRENPLELMRRSMTRHRQKLTMVALAALLAAAFIGVRDLYRGYHGGRDFTNLLEQASADERLQQWTAAEQEYRRALELHPGDATAVSGLERIAPHLHPEVAPAPASTPTPASAPASAPAPEPGKTTPRFLR
jgi:predicted Ser/Thr protein kinase